MPANADTVFDIVADLANTTWLPAGVEIELPGPGLLRLWISSAGQDHDLDRPLRIDWERLRVERGSDPTASCTGLGPGAAARTGDVLGSGAAHRSAPGPTALVDEWIDDALEALAAEVRLEIRRA